MKKDTASYLALAPLVLALVGGIIVPSVPGGLMTVVGGSPLYSTSAGMVEIGVWKSNVMGKEVDACEVWSGDTPLSPSPPSACFEDQFDYYGNDLSKDTASSASDCQSQCQFHTQCEYFTFRRVLVDQGVCWLKTSAAGRRAISTPTVSGPKRCGAATAGGTTSASASAPCPYVYHVYPLAVLARTRSARFPHGQHASLTVAVRRLCSRVISR